jgi:hypothetical protein
VVHLLHEEPVRSEDVAEVRQCLLGRRFVTADQRLVDLAPQTAREHDQPVAVLRQQFGVDARLVPVALEVGAGGELDEVAVPGVVDRQCGQVVVAVAVWRAGLVVPGPVRLVQLGAQDRGDPLGRGGTEELDQAEQDAMVGHGHGRLPVGGHGVHQVTDPRRPVEHRVLGVDVEVDEPVRGGHVVPSRGRGCVGHGESIVGGPIVEEPSDRACAGKVASHAQSGR